MAYTNERRGFKTREAAEAFQIQQSVDPAYSCLHPAFKGDVIVRDQIHRARGKVHVWKYKAKSKGGDIREYFASYVGA
jgi:hypothetical protein